MNGLNLNHALRVLRLAVTMLLISVLFSMASALQNESGWIYKVDSSIDTAFVTEDSESLIFDENKHLIKLSRDGQLVWKNSELLGPLYTTNSKILIDDEGNIIIKTRLGLTDKIENTPEYEKFALVREAYNDCIIKYTKNGDFLWIKSWRSSECCEESGFLDTAIALGKECDVYIAGRYAYEIDIDPGHGVYMLESGEPGSKNFVCKLDKDGNFKWVREFGSPGVCDCYGIVWNENQTISLVGAQGDSFDADPGEGKFLLSPIDDSPSLFFLSLDEDGNFVKALSSRGFKYEFYQGILWDKSGNSYYFGLISYENAGYKLKTRINYFQITKVSPEGALLWQKVIETTDSSLLNKKFLTRDGVLYFLSRETSGFNVDLSKQTENPTNKPVYQLWRINKNGQLNWIKEWMTEGRVELDIAGVDANGDLYTSAYNTEKASIDLNLSSIEIDSPSKYLIKIPHDKY